LASAGFQLEERPKAGKVGKARIAYANVPCEHVRSASGEWVLQIELNPRGKDTTMMMMSFPETRAVKDARRAEGVPTFESDCLQRRVQQLGDSIQAKALAGGHSQQ
jgi:DICT domain-containing protein